MLLTSILQGEGQKERGIYIKSVVPGGAAALVSIHENHNSFEIYNKLFSFISSNTDTLIG